MEARSLEECEKKLVCRGIAFSEKKILIIEKLPNAKGKYRAYDGDKILFVTEEQRREWRHYPRASEYMLVRQPINRNTKIKEYYIEFCKMADELKIETKGLVNMYKTGHPSRTALKLFYDFINKTTIRPQEIEEYERCFLQDCGGALRYARPYKGKMYKYDANSWYPYNYSNVYLLIPIKKGILKTVTQKDLDNMRHFEFGVYHCIIVKSDDDLLVNGLFWINRENYYTHYELTYARDHKYKIKMIDEPDNFLHYPRNYCKTGSEIFGGYVGYLYPKKQAGCAYAKDLLNSLWGNICKLNLQKKVVNIADGYKESDGWTTITTNIISDTQIEIYRLSANQMIFESNFARMKPFLLAKCRLNMAKIIEPIIDNVFYSHTDSIISNIPLTNLRLSQELGCFKYEGEISEVKNMNSYTDGIYNSDEEDN